MANGLRAVLVDFATLGWCMVVHGVVCGGDLRGEYHD
jgi:hypothetical protein